MTQDNARPRVEQYAEAIADTACDLADTTRSQDWNAASQDDLLEAIDTLAGALSALGPDIARALAPVTAATAAARRHLGLADGDGNGPEPAAGALASGAVRRPRRGLGPWFQGHPYEPLIRRCRYDRRARARQPSGLMIMPIASREL
jgi:hypothetical protein